LDNDIIKFLNRGTKEYLNEVNVIDRTNSIMDAKKVLAIRRLTKMSRIDCMR